MLYLAMFATSTFFFYLGEHIRGNRQERRLVFFVAILFPILMAGFRSENVGIDIGTYAKPIYTLAEQSANLKEFYSLIPTQLSTRDLEPGFTFISYIATKFSHKLWGELTAYELLIMSAIFKASLNYKAFMANKGYKYQAWISIIVFYGLFYNMSLTMLRQSIACSFVLLAITEVLISNNAFKSILIIALATTFHSTALIGYVFLIFWYASKNKDTFNKKAYKGLIFTAFMIFFLGGNVYWLILNILNKFIIIPGRYKSYAYMWGQGNGVNVAWMYLILIGLAIAVLLNKLKINFDNSVSEKLFLLIAIYSLALYPLSIASANAGRVEYYFMYFFILLMPLTEYTMRYFKVKGKSFYRFCVILYSLIYWVGTVGLNDMTGTINYILM